MVRRPDDSFGGHARSCPLLRPGRTLWTRGGFYGMRNEFSGESDGLPLVVGKLSLMDFRWVARSPARNHRRAKPIVDDGTLGEHHLESCSFQTKISFISSSFFHSFTLLVKRRSELHFGSISGF